LIAILTPKGPRHFLAQKPFKIAMSATFIQETKQNKIFANVTIGSCTSLVSNFMKFDRTNWKILAFKVEKESFFER